MKRVIARALAASLVLMSASCESQSRPHAQPNPALAPESAPSARRLGTGGALTCTNAGSGEVCTCNGGCLFPSNGSCCTNEGFCGCLAPNATAAPNGNIALCWGGAGATCP
jgi:hypothetical protein